MTALAAAGNACAADDETNGFQGTGRYADDPGFLLNSPDPERGVMEQFDPSRIFLFTVLILALAGPALPEMRESEPAGICRNVAVDTCFLDINAVECCVSNNGQIAGNPVTWNGGFWFPAGQRDKSMIYSGGLWIVGMIDGDIRSAATYYQTEFQPGRILADGTPDDPSKPGYRMYKYNRGQPVDPEAVIQGCPAEVMGDQMVFGVFNDITDHAWVWKRPPIGLEVQCTGWGYDREGGLDHCLFFRYRIVHKGAKPLKDAYVALFLDPDIGQSTDDDAGCDSTLDLGFAFNADSADNKYGTGVPAVGCGFLRGPLVDSPGSTAHLPDGTVLTGKRVLGMTSFFPWLCGSPVPGMNGPGLQDSTGAVQAYFFMQGKMDDGDPWVDPTAGNAITRYPFAGDPIAGTGWLLRDIEGCGERYMGIASGPFDLEPGGAQDLVIGLVAGLGTDYLNSVAVMKDHSRAMRQAYQDGFSGLPLESRPETFGLSQNFPNPFNSETTIFFNLKERGQVKLAVYDALGREIRRLADGSYDPGKYSVLFDAPGFPAGLYVYQIITGGVRVARKMAVVK